MVAIKHLPFNFGEKVGFVNYCPKSLYLSTCRVPKLTLTHIFFNLNRKSKKDLIKYFKNYDGKVTICFDI